MLALGAAASAGTLTYGVDGGMGETDNVTLVRNDKVRQTFAVTDFDLDYAQKSQRLDVNAKADFSYFDYLQNAYPTQLLGRFDGIADFALIPQRLTWTLRDNFGQAAIDPFTPTTPGNLQNINAVTTGPELYLRLGGATFLDLSARLIYTQFGTSPFTNTRLTGSAAYGIKLSAVSSVSVNGDTQRVSFENTTLNTNFELSKAFVRYELQGARTQFTADAGVAVINENGSSNTGGLARLELSRRLSASARLTVALGHDTTDATNSFGRLQSGASGVLGTAVAPNTSENYTSNYGSVNWEYQHNRTTLALSGRWEKDLYANQPTLDRTLETGELRLRRVITRAFAVQIIGRVYKSDYSNVNFLTAGSPNNAINSIVAAVTWRHGRALELKLAGEHTNYTTSPNDTGYRENRIFLLVGYRPFQETSVFEGVEVGPTI